MLDLGLSSQDLASAFCVAMFAGFGNGVAGFGFALLAGPLLIMIDPAFLPGPVILLVGLITAMMIFRERNSISRTNVKRSVLGFLIGTGGAATLLARLPQRELTFLLGGLILLAVLISVSGISVRPNRRVLFSAGVLGGFMGTVSGMSMPPLALALQNEPGPRLRATMACVSFISVLMSLIALTAVGQVGAREILLGFFLTPAVVIGYFSSLKMTSILDRGFTRIGVFVLSTTSAVVMILQNI